MPGLSTTAIDAFIDGMHAGVLVAAGVAFLGAIIALVWLPARVRATTRSTKTAPTPMPVFTTMATCASSLMSSPPADAVTETRFEGTRRAPGRPRSLEADEAILEAAVDVFAEVGLEALTMEGVAARAGVSKNTVYRRYPNKLDLVVSAVRCYTNVGAPPPDTGTTRGDVHDLVEGLVAILTETPIGRMLPILVAVRTGSPSSTPRTPRSSPRSAPVTRRWCGGASSGATSAPMSTSTSWSTRSRARRSTGSS